MTENVVKAVQHIAASRARPSVKLLDALYGPQAKSLRTRVAALLLGRKVTGSDRAAQHTNLCAALVGAVGASGDCPASVFEDFERKAAALLNGEPATRTEAEKVAADTAALVTQVEPTLPEANGHAGPAAEGNPFAAKKTRCPVTRKQFRANAKSLAVRIGDKEFKAVVKKFSTGSLGWNANEKVTLTLSDGTEVTCQVGLNVTIVNSKEAAEG